MKMMMMMITVSRNFLQPSLMPRVHALHRRKTLNPPYIKPLDKITTRLQNRASKTLLQSLLSNGNPSNKDDAVQERQVVPSPSPTRLSFRWVQ